MKKLLIGGVCVGLIHLNSAFAVLSPKAAHKSLAAVPATELPAQAAQLVKDANAADRQADTATVVKAAVSHRPATAAAVVGAIAQAVPEVAAVAAGTAAKAQPKLASVIAQAAAAAAPSQAGEIVVAVCRAAPGEFRAVALAVAKAAPGSEKEVLRALSVAFASLKPGIEDAISTYAANPASFAGIVASLKPTTVTVAQNGNGALDGVRGPTIAPPYVPPSGSPANITPSSSGQVPTGGRDYAKP